MDTYRHIQTGIQHREYPMIGAGSARKVYDLENGIVAKVAKNAKGYAQNETEWQIYNSENSFLLAKVLDITEDNSILFMQKADKIYKNSDLQKYLKEMEEKLPYQAEIEHLSDKYELMSGDLDRASSWGIIDGRLVLIDYGFTLKIRRKYYQWHLF